MPFDGSLYSLGSEKGRLDGKYSTIFDNLHNLSMEQKSNTGL